MKKLDLIKLQNCYCWKSPYLFLLLKCHQFLLQFSLQLPFKRTTSQSISFRVFPYKDQTKVATGCVLKCFYQIITYGVLFNIFTWKKFQKSFNSFSDILTTRINKDFSSNNSSVTLSNLTSSHIFIIDFDQKSI